MTTLPPGAQTLLDLFSLGHSLFKDFRTMVTTIHMLHILTREAEKEVKGNRTMNI